MDGERPPLCSRDHRVELVLDPDGVGGVRQPEPAGETLYMGVDRKAWEPEGDAPDHVRRLPPDTREGHQVRKLSRHLRVEAVDEPLGHADEVAGLGPEEARRPDQLFELRAVGGRQRGRIGIAREEGRRREVDPFVGALGGKDGGRQELERVPVSQCAELLCGTGVLRAETCQRLPCATGRSPRSAHRRRLPVASCDMGGDDLQRVEVSVASPPTGDLLGELDALSRTVSRTIDHAALSDHKWIELRRAQLSGGAGAGGSTVVVTGRHRGVPELLGAAILCGVGEPSEAWAVELMVSPAVGLELGDALLREAIAEVDRRGGGPLRLWSPKASTVDDRRAERFGFQLERNLIQMRCRLPLAPSGGRGIDADLEVRPFRPGVDEDGWLVVNNRAFASHPEQGRWDRVTLLEHEREPWFDPDGFLLFEHDGRLAGFCWTKIHADTSPPMGEIFVIGVDPDFHGRGWGRTMTATGFESLAARGLQVGMLYVDGDNVAAVNLYRSMGLADDHVDRSYFRVVDG